jgi:hypothetical protein
MGGGHTKGSMESQYYGLRATNFTLFWLLFRTEAVLPEETKNKSLRTTTKTPPCPSEAEEKDLLESDRLNGVANL